jgi:hypothetical protein
LSATGIRTECPKYPPSVNKVYEPNTSGTINSSSPLVKEGVRYKMLSYSAIGILKKIAQRVEIFIEAKKYSPGEYCRNLTPTAGFWNI